jgi:hypothetical protein
MAAVCYNFRRILARIAALLCALVALLLTTSETSDIQLNAT